MKLTSRQFSLAKKIYSLAILFGTDSNGAIDDMQAQIMKGVSNQALSDFHHKFPNEILPATIEDCINLAIKLRY